MSLGVTVKVQGTWSQFSIYDVDGSADCEDGAGKKIKNRDGITAGMTFYVTIDGQEPNDPGEVEVSGLAAGDTAKTIKSYPVTKIGGVITFPHEGVSYPSQTTLEMIRANPDFDAFVLEVGNRFRSLASQEKHPQVDETDDHPH